MLSGKAMIIHLIVDIVISLKDIVVYNELFSRTIWSWKKENKI